MIFTPAPLKDAFTIDTEPFQDERGLFARTFCKNEFQQIEHKGEFVQFNHSHTNLSGTIRGMHYQLPPFSEIKLIRCIKGEVFDVIIDIRKGSPTFLQYFSVTLSEENMKMIYIPEGFAHGFQTLRDHSELIYHHTNFYTPGMEGGIRYDDPAININWPEELTTISEKDKNMPYLSNDFQGI